MKKFLALILCALMAVSCFVLTSCNDDGAADDSSVTTAADGETAGGDAATDAPKATKDVPCTDIVAALEKAFEGELPEVGSYYFPVDDEYSDNFVEPDNVNYTWTGNWDVFPEFEENVVDYAIRLPSGKSAIEFHIVKVKDAASVEILKPFVEARVAQIQSGDVQLYVTDGSYEKQMENVSLFTAGNYICLTITTDKAKAESTISSVLFE